MYEEYDQEVPNLRVMLYDVSIAEALDYKKQIEQVDGVEEVTWLDDKISVSVPLEMMDQDTVDTWYKDGNALYQITIDETNGKKVIDEIRDIIGDDNCMDGTAVNDALAPVQTSNEIAKIMLFVLPLVFLILILTTTSWFEPVLFLITIGVAIMLNRGTNLMFGTISFVTNAAGGILQLAVSMDYAIFILHRFVENRQAGEEVQDAMVDAVKQSVGSVLSSGLTTVSGFAALILMRFRIGPDMGWVMAKAIVLSLFSVLCFLPALTMISYKLIDKTQHRSFVPKFEKFSTAVLKVRVPVLTVFVLILIPCIWAQNNNSFYYGSSQVYSSALVLMVPTGDSKSEAKLGKELEDIERVTSVISYANTVGTMIPEEMIPEDLVSQLYSEDYSRYVVMVNMGEESKGWDKKVDEIRKTGEKYYGKETLLAGDLASTEDLKTTITQDMTWVNILAIGFVFLILLFNFKSLFIPVLLTVVIEASIWINLAVPYFQHTTLHYIAYLIISSVQLGTLVGRGATISFILVIFVLPTLLMLFDKCIEKTTWHASLYKEEKKKISLKV